MAKFYLEEKSGPVRKAFEAEVLAWPGVRTKMMFSCPSYSAKGELFAFLVTDGVVLTKLGAEDRETLGRRFQVGPFQPGPREVSAWSRVEVRDPAALERLLPFVRKSYEATRKAK